MPPPLLERHQVRIIGRLDAPDTLVFVHGFGTSQQAWQAVAQAFESSHRLVLLNNAGCGAGAGLGAQRHRYLNLRAYAEDLVAIGAALDLQGATLIGHSAGAMICALAALRQPALARRLVLIGASPRYLDAPGYVGGFSDADLNALYRAVTLNYEQWAEAFAPVMMGNPDRPALALRLADSIKSIPPEDALTTLCAIFQSDHRADLAQLRQPTLLIQAHEDAAVPLSVAEYMLDKIPHARLALIEAAGHLPHVSAPQQVVEAIADFLAVQPLATPP
ncbi:alpha/beta fold hydrolase [Roseateles microcysteis]|uniref:alpha/beta fold hydrolase n=1 Tax=Roseateles microcysteis TaxID=3119057 RepID=UPI002FE5A1E4